MKIKTLEAMAIFTFLFAFVYFVNKEINIEENKPTLIQKIVSHVSAE